MEYDDGEFRAWQREFRLAHGKVPRTRAAPPKYTRKSKVAFRPAMVEAFFIPDHEALRSAIDSGIINVMKQGKQASGRAGSPKYSMDLVKARWSDLLLVQKVV